MREIVGRALGDTLHAEGLLPPNCSLVEVRIPANGAPTIQYTVFVAREDLAKLARAMERASLPPEKKPSASVPPSEEATS